MASSSITSKQQHKIAIVFNGLIRSLKYTISNLESHVFKPITDAGWTYDVYCHNFTLEIPYSNERNEELSIQLDTEDYKLLNPQYYMTDSQTAVGNMLNLSSYRSKGNPWPNSPNYKTLNNYILSQWSKSQITRLLERNITNGIAKYDQVWFVRSDVVFATPIDPTKCLALLKNDNDCIIPNFHHYKGCNDRMFIARPNLAIKYGTYFDQLLPLSKSIKLHSESINKLLLTRYKANVHLDSSIVFQRVRTNGTVDKRDVDLVQNQKCLAK